MKQKQVGRELRQQNSDPKETEIEPQKHLEEFENSVIKHMKEKEKVNNPIEELDALINTLKKKFEGSVQAIKIRKICKDEKRFGLLDSGATNNVREAKKKTTKDSFRL